MVRKAFLLYFFVTHLRHFLPLYEKHGPFLSRTYTNSFIKPSLTCSRGSMILSGTTKGLLMAFLSAIFMLSLLIHSFLTQWCVCYFKDKINKDIGVTVLLFKEKVVHILIYKNHILMFILLYLVKD